ncbi:hypothetical protein [Sneathiella aquimaris]|uniref:hypothetical protein n=1 Tax=Sneathiella aquimaris TaxID=2599305 RepID=UPI00146CBDA0|nr:hypothetical protein [Sneathiella aquimaris]
MVAVGGIHVPANHCALLEKKLNSLCLDAGFPNGEAFKWSPSKKLWMYQNLVGGNRTKFILDACDIAKELSVKAVVVAEGKNWKPATSERIDHELDATKLVAERYERELKRTRKSGAIVVSAPSGGHKQAAELIKTIDNLSSEGTRYVKANHISFCYSTGFERVRCLQLADIIVSVSLAMITGRKKYSSEVFESIKPMFYSSNTGEILGWGMKIHPSPLQIQVEETLAINLSKENLITGPKFCSSNSNNYISKHTAA